MKYFIFLGFCGVLAFTGCAPTSYTRLADESAATQDTLQQPATSTQDVIQLSKAGVSDKIIIAQMTATHTSFQLSKEDLINLQQAGVSETVITAMIASQPQSTTPEPRRTYVYGDWYYPYYCGWDPWYPPFYVGLGFYAPGYRGFGFRGGGAPAGRR